MFVIFCSDPLAGRQPDTAYTDEVAAVRALSGTDTLLDYEVLRDGHDPARAVRRVAARPSMTLALYRG